MTTLTFDTHAAVKKLIASGMPDEQAEAQVEVLSEVLSANLGELATKQDLRELEMRLDARFEALRGEFDVRFEALRGEFDVRFSALTGELNARFEALKGEQTLLKWMLGLLLGGVAALVLKAVFPL
jgi:hypothetical protein